MLWDHPHSQPGAAEEEFPFGSPGSKYRGASQTAHDPPTKHHREQLVSTAGCGPLKLNKNKPKNHNKRISVSLGPRRGVNSVLWKGTSQAQGWVGGNHVMPQCQPTSLFGFSESWSSRWSRGLRIKIRARAPAPLSKVWSPLPACPPARYGRNSWKN